MKIEIVLFLIFLSITHELHKYSYSSIGVDFHEISRKIHGVFENDNPALP